MVYTKRIYFNFGDIGVELMASVDRQVLYYLSHTFSPFVLGIFEIESRFMSH
jgi:hypothetical protein